VCGGVRVYLSLERKHHLSVSHFFFYVFQCFAFQYMYLQVESYATSIPFGFLLSCNMLHLCKALGHVGLIFLGAGVHLSLGRKHHFLFSIPLRMNLALQYMYLLVGSCIFATCIPLGFLLPWNMLLVCRALDL
jgi:hypothetical protein